MQCYFYILGSAEKQLAQGNEGWDEINGYDDDVAKKPLGYAMMNGAAAAFLAAGIDANIWLEDGGGFIEGLAVRGDSLRPMEDGDEPGDEGDGNSQ